MVQQILPLNTALRIDSFLARAAAYGLRVRRVKMSLSEFWSIGLGDRHGMIHGVPIQLVSKDVWTS